MTANLSLKNMQSMCQGTLFTLYHVPLHHCIASPFRYITATYVLLSSQCINQWFGSMNQHVCHQPMSISILTGFTSGRPLLVLVFKSSCFSEEILSYPCPTPDLLPRVLYCLVVVQMIPMAAAGWPPRSPLVDIMTKMRVNIRYIGGAI